MTAPILLIHGWGFGPGVWDAVADHLPAAAVLRVDLGFRGDTRVPAVERPLVVGHSMGLPWALQHIPGPWAGAVAVNSFPRFTRTEDFADGVPPHRLARMRAQFADAPAEVTSAFLAQVGLPDADVSDIRPGPLGEALAWLAEMDLRPALAALDCPFVALAGAQDALVGEAMSRAGFAGRGLEFHPEAGHLLPLSHPQWVAGRVARLVSS
jgi:pimeloyl-[acyl-carrier protein] methyl ester esterase